MFEPLIDEAIEELLDYHQIISQHYDRATGGAIVWHIDEDAELKRSLFEQSENFVDCWDYNREQHYTKTTDLCVTVNGVPSYTQTEGAI